MQPDTVAALRQLMMGFRTSQLLYVAAKLGLADAISRQPKTATEIAREVNADPDALRRVLRAFTAMGVFVETSDGKLRLGDTGELLRSDLPGSLRNVAVLYGEGWLWHAYGNMLYSVRTGKPAFPIAHGEGFYEFLERHPDASTVFHAAMDDFSKTEAAGILGAYSFSGVKSVIDVGCGRGALLSTILKAHPQLEGVGFDMPEVEPECVRQFRDAGVADRASFVGGDFFGGVPGGRELYILKSVLHNWDDAAAEHVLHVCRQAVPRAGRVLIIERVISDSPAGTEAKLFDINMLVTVGGRERTEQEYRSLLAAAEFTLVRTVATASPLTILEAAPEPA
jgi:hypothetical protein